MTTKNPDGSRGQVNLSKEGEMEEESRSWISVITSSAFLSLKLQEKNEKSKG